MAPIDRAEREARRQQRKRGAGTSSAVADFNFNFNFAGPPAKHSSVPPSRPQRTPTPKQQTPRAALSSTKRHRSASVHRSSSVKRHVTPKALVTPQLGKRKRGSRDAEALDDHGEPDELSPDQNNETHSIERPHRVVGTVSPINEEEEGDPDELTVVLDDHTVDTRVDVAPPAKTPTPAGSSLERGARASATSSARSRTSTRRSKSTEAPPETPSILPNRRDRQSRLGTIATPEAGLDENEEDELTPAPASVTPRVVGKQPTVASIAQEEQEEQEEDDLDELSTPAKSNDAGTTPTPALPNEQPDQPTASMPARRGRPKRVVGSEESMVQVTPAVRKQQRRKTSSDIQEAANTEDTGDVLPPEAHRTGRPTAKPKQDLRVRHQEESVEASSAEGESEREQSMPQDDTEISILPATKDKPAKRAESKATRKSYKPSGPKQAISVMRIKGSTVRGVTVADTTRTILEENIDHQVQRLAAKMQTAEDSSRRKKLRGHINIALAFKESLVEKLMDLQDANDSLSAGFKKRKLLMKDNVERRKDILAMQNKRHEIALEMDEERAVYDEEKAKAEAKSKLSDDMFAIQAAIQSGRARARREGREDEGPERGLSMLMDSVGRRVGSVGGGLLTSLQQFNEGLERAAGWLEGRA